MYCHVEWSDAFSDVAVGDYEDGPCIQGDYGYITIQYQRIVDRDLVLEYTEVRISNE